MKEWKHKRFANAEKAGYAGTAILSKHKPIAFTSGIGKSKHDKEGRVVTAEVKKYTPKQCVAHSVQPYIVFVYNHIDLV